MIYYENVLLLTALKKIGFTTSTHVLAKQPPIRIVRWNPGPRSKWVLTMSNFAINLWELIPGGSGQLEHRKGHVSKVRLRCVEWLSDDGL